MKRLIGTWALLALCAGAIAQSPEEIARIEAALPAKATVQPAKQRKVLVFSLALGFQHASIPYGEKAFELMGKKSGAFTATVSRDLRSFDPESLKQYDAIIFNNTTGELFTSATQRNALLEFIRGGRGVVGIHSATDTCYNWADFGNMMGGYFNGHPWTAESTVTLKVDAPKHPVAGAFKAQPFTVVDEIYQFKEPYSRLALRVLTSLDITKTDMEKPGVNRPDNDFPVSWVHDFGTGRVFYCSLGHNKHIYWNPTVLQHYLDGIQYALGDLKAAGSPTASEATSALEQSLPGAMASFAKDEVDQDNRGDAMLDLFSKQSAQVPAARRLIARELAKCAAGAYGSGATFAARQCACRKLAGIGTEQDVEVLAPMLMDADPKISDAGRLAIERIPGKTSTEVLGKALASVPPLAKIGIINSLGARRDPAGVPTIAPLVKSSDAGTVVAAAEALGIIGSTEAADAIKAALAGATTETRAALEDSHVRAGLVLAKTGKLDQAREIFQNAMKAGPASQARLAAFQGLLQLSGTNVEREVLQALGGNDRELQGIAIAALLNPKTKVSTAQLLTRLEQAPDEQKPVLIQVLGSRGDVKALSALVPYINETRSAPVRLAAIRAMGHLGDKSSVRLLADAAAKMTGPDREAARASLRALKPLDVDATVIAVLSELGENSDKSDVYIELLRAAGERNNTESIPELLKAAVSSDEKVQIQAAKSLTMVGDVSQISATVGLLGKTTSDKVRTELEKTLLALVRKEADKAKQVELVLPLAEQATDTNIKASLVRVVGNLASDQTLALLRSTAAGAADEKLGDAAIRALIDYPAASAIEDVRQLAQSSGNETHKVLASRGFARLLALPSDRETSKTLEYCNEALQMAVSTEDKKAVVGSLADVNEPLVLPLVLGLTENADLQEEARRASLKLAVRNWAFLPGEATSVSKMILDGPNDEDSRKDARRIQTNIKQTSDTIPGWQVAGPFTDETSSALAALMEHAFAPEQADAAVRWKNAAVDVDKEGPELVDLLKKIGGNDRVAYLRVKVWSPEERAAKLEMGSDDALRAWFNGKVVRSTSVERGFNPKSDRVDVTLKQGWNYLMLKVGQVSGDWSAAARVVNGKGKSIAGLKYDALSLEPNTPFITE